MGVSYKVIIRPEHKQWIALKSIEDNIPIYIIFQEILFPYYINNYTDETKLTNIIPPISFDKNEDTEWLLLESSFAKSVRKEAIRNRITVISMIDFIFSFYLHNHGFMQADS